MGESPSPLKSIQKLTSCNFRKSKENQTQTHQKRVTKLSKTCSIYLAHILPPRVTRAVCQVILPSSPWQVCIWICVVGLGPGILSPCMRWLPSLSISWGPFCKPGGTTLHPIITLIPAGPCPGPCNSPHVPWDPGCSVTAFVLQGFLRV